MRRLSIIELGTFKNWGGKEQHIVELSEGLKSLGQDVLLVTRNTGSINTTVNKVSLSLRGAFDVVSIFKLAGLIRRSKADIVHVHNGREAWIAVFAVILAKRGKVVLTRHAVLLPKNTFYYAWLYRRIAKIICVSNITKNIFLDKCTIVKPEQVIVLYNGINPERVLSGNAKIIKEKYNIGSEEKIIGFVGKYDWSKGVEILIKAARLVVSNFPETKFLLVGKAQKGMESYEQELRQMIISLSLENNVILHGFSSDIADIMSAIDIFVLPSVTPESFGLVLLEAMAAGKPVITTNNGGQIEFLINNETGLLVEPGNHEELSAKICQLITNPSEALRLSANGRQEMMEKFTIEKMTTETLKIFEMCL